jgi:hypothetical protein
MISIRFGDVKLIDFYRYLTTALLGFKMVIRRSAFLVLIMKNIIVYIFNPDAGLPEHIFGL